MQHSTRSLTIATGLAMFSMFFGAGNVVFPLTLGRYAQEYNIWAMCGLAITAIAMPFVGVVALALYDGNYSRFFGRLGRPAGFICILLALLLIGPAGAAPRTITVSFATVHLMLPWMTLPLFGLLTCIVVFLCSWRLTRIVDLLGYVMTPILLLAIGIIIVKGLIGAPEAGPAPDTRLMLFRVGLEEGYKTMDLLGAFFFSHVALLCLKREVPAEMARNPRQMALMILRSSVVGAICLAAIYWGVSYVMAYRGADFQETLPDFLLATVAHDQLGIVGGVIACVAVSFACLTTAIALCSVFAEYLQTQIFLNKIGYVPSLVITLVATFAVSLVGFGGIDAYLLPILQIMYPAFIVLTFANIGHKLWGWTSVKIPFVLTLIGSFIVFRWYS